MSTVAEIAAVHEPAEPTRPVLAGVRILHDPSGRSVTGVRPIERSGLDR